MAQNGFWGGQGCAVPACVLCVEELGRVCATTGVIVSAKEKFIL